MSRTQKSRDSVEQSVAAIARSNELNEQELGELVSIVYDGLFKSILDINAINASIKEHKGKVSKVEIKAEEKLWDLVRYAGLKGWLIFEAPPASMLQSMLKRRVNSQSQVDLRSVTVTQSGVLDHVATQAAEKLFEIIWEVNQAPGNKNEIHVGISGGRTMRRVMEAFAGLLEKKLQTKPTRDQCPRIVFHALVAGFGSDDFWADPQIFMSYFVVANLTEHVQFIRLPLPSICNTKVLQDLRNTSQAVSAVYEQAKKLHIIITSGGSWDDPHSTLRRYTQEVGNGSATPGAIGDLLWQPLGMNAPITITTDDRATSLLTLDEMAGFIAGKYREDKTLGRVLLVLGACAECHQPKGKLLQAILNQDKPLVTDLVIDTPTIRQWQVL